MHTGESLFRDGNDGYGYKEKIRKPADRRMSKKTDKRTQSSRIHVAEGEAREQKQPPLMTGVVTRVYRGRCTVKDRDRFIECVLRSHIAETQQTAIAPGDEVEFTLAAADAGRVERVIERRTVFTRRDPGNRNIERVIAANIELVVAVVSARNPDLKIRFIDRIVFAAESGGAKAAVCVNKVDLLSPSERQELEARLSPYREIGVTAVYCSAETGEGIEELYGLLRGKRSVLAGHSGVGKSSILNALIPDAGVRTGEVGAARHGRASAKGRHTTTESTMYFPERSGSEPESPHTTVIDTPGVREFDTGETDLPDLMLHFREFAPYAGRCRLSGCTHSHEPECAVRTAVREGAIPRSRYESYLKLAGLFHASTTENADEQRQRDRGAFRCGRCGREVPLGAPGTGHRNHCPFCLWSVHVDHKPGDRSAFCTGLMEPVAVWERSGEWVIIHRCTECGTLHSNRIAGDDSEGVLLALAMRPLSRTPFAIERLGLQE